MDSDFIDEYGDLPLDNWWLEGRRAVVSAAIHRVGLLPAPQPLRVLDVGCGSGSMMPLLLQVGQVTGIDASAEMIEKCRGRFGAELNLQVAERVTDLAPQRFEMVTAFDVIEHVELEAPFLHDLKEAITPGGHLVCTVPAYQWMWGEQDVVSRHYRRYTKKRLVSALEGAGFRLTFASYFNTLLFPMIAGVRGLKRFIPQKGEAASDFTSIPAAAEPVLGRIFSLEAGLVSRVRLPFGVSLLAIASNPA